MLRQTVFAMATVSLLAACNADGTVRQNTIGGAAIGALAGAGVGALIGKRKGALIGAGIGAIGGAGIGNYLDEQQAQLNRDLAGTGATVTNTGDAIMVNLPAGVTFPTDSASIQPQFFEPLSKVANTLVQFESSLIDVIGHTDNSGADAYNQELSERRAQAVANYFRDRGVIGERIVAYGRGETQPVATNATAEGRSANRRVELMITPLTK
jgi:outer membrane protein OmpA-like peptidoglycan-associated protein